MQKPLTVSNTLFGYRRYKFILSVLSIILCSSAVAAAAIPGPQRAIAPTWFGFHQLAPNIYASIKLKPEELAPLISEIEHSTTAISAFYNQPLFTSSIFPRIILCPKDTCDAAFGVTKSRGIAYGSLLIRLNEKGLNRTIATHELSHIALKQRVGRIRAFFGAVPAWFDEGLAVLLSNDERFNKKFPPTAALYLRQTGSFRTWDKSKKALGWKNAYGGSMELVRELQKEIGREGVLAILDNLNRGQDFETALSSVRKALPDTSLF